MLPYKKMLKHLFSPTARQAKANIYQGLKVFIPVMALLFILAVYFVFFRFFRPLSWIHQGAKRIGSGELGYRIPYQRSDELGQLVKVVNDMAEDLEHIFDSKRQLLLAISHELRTPLTRMKLNIALLDDCSASKRLHQDVADMATIVDDLLESEKLQEQHQALLLAPMKLSTLLDELASQYSTTLGLKVHPSKDDEPTLLLDVARIRLLINNLIQNAIKQTDAASRDISISHFAEKHQSIIEVKDNGKGIATEHAKHIFSAFYRIDNARGRQTGGVGLGLYLCRSIALAHKGDLSLNSSNNDNQGSSFRLTLPHND